MKKIQKLAMMLCVASMCIGLASCENCNHELTEPQISCQIHNRSFGAKEYNNICIGTITSNEKLNNKNVEIYNDWVDARIETPTIDDNGNFVYPVYADIEANTTTKNTSRNIHVDFIGVVTKECDCGNSTISNTSTGVFRGYQWRELDPEISENDFIGTWELTNGYYGNGTDYSYKHYTSRYMTLDITDENSGVATNVVDGTEFPGSADFTFTVNGDKVTFKSGYTTTTYNVIAIAYNLIVLEYYQGNSLHTLEFYRQGWH